MKPSRMAAMARSSEAFVLNFFDSNPLSHLALLLLRDGVASQLSELTSPPDAHIKTLHANLSASSPASLQNVVEAVAHVPAYGHRELLLLFAALASTDPGDILPAIRRARAAHLRCSIIGVGGAEVHICRQIAEQTGGRYSVAMDDVRPVGLWGSSEGALLSHAPPPPVQAGSAGSAASLVRMGFPQRAPEGAAALCACHMHLRLAATYVCPSSRVCALPAECPECALTLVSSPHLARSYHHLFPVPPFSEIPLPPAPNRPAGSSAPAAPHSDLPPACFSCTAALPFIASLHSGWRSPCVCPTLLPFPLLTAVPLHLPFLFLLLAACWLHAVPMWAETEGGGVRVECPTCARHFCFDCDVFIHESLHNCPGCEATRLPQLP
ncbi:unnamed protein product [Closterium sp. NIES-65]|nr:unnamed protein product [Closterium sp. NIES-65]